MSASSEPPAAINWHPKPIGPLGPYFTYAGDDNFNGGSLKRYMRTNGLFAPLTRLPPQQGEETRAPHQTATPGNRSSILDHILIPTSPRKRIEGCRVDHQWTSSPSSPFDHGAIALFVAPKFPKKTYYDNRRLDDRRIQKQISKTVRRVQEHLRKAGSQEDQLDRTHLETGRAKTERRKTPELLRTIPVPTIWTFEKRRGVT